MPDSSDALRAFENEPLPYSPRGLRGAAPRVSHLDNGSCALEVGFLRLTPVLTMRLLAVLVALLVLSACASTSLEDDRAPRPIAYSAADYRALVASGLTPEQALDVQSSDSLAALVPQTDAVLEYRQRWQRSARADSLRDLPAPSRMDTEWLAAYDAEVQARAIEDAQEAFRASERRRVWLTRVGVTVGVVAVGYVAYWLLTFELY